MANPTSAVDLDLTYDQQLAVAVSDGTYADVIETTKTDAVGFEAPASAQPVAAGQLWGNFVDDFMRATWDGLQGSRVFRATTTNNTLFRPTLYTIPFGGSVWIEVRGQARSADPEEVASIRLAGLFFTSGVGFTSVIDPTTSLIENGLVGLLSSLTINGRNIELRYRGLVGYNIRWSFYIKNITPLEEP